MRFLPLWLLLCCLTVGCGSSSPFDYVPVSGTVTYEDGSPLPGGFKLIFIAQDAAQVEGAVPRPAQANVDSHGNFDCVTSHKYGDGLIPGKHKVVIQAAAVQNGRPIFPKSCLSAETTPLVVDTADVPLVIKVPKP